jgi:DNA-binding NarL/FixJ family response regulator
MGNRKSVTIVSPQVLFRNGLEYLLANEPDIQVIGSVDFNNGVEHVLEKVPPDTAIIDIDAAPDLGFDIAQRIKYRLPNIGIIIFSSNTNDEELFASLKAQASAYLSKEAAGPDIVKTIKTVAEGGYPINECLQTKPGVAEQVLRKFQQLSLESETQEVLSPLTQRETEILGLIAEGYLNKQIAASLDISEQTIKNHVTSILRKLNANARTEAVVIAIRQGLISID